VIFRSDSSNIEAIGSPVPGEGFEPQVENVASHREILTLQRPLGHEMVTRIAALPLRVNLDLTELSADCEPYCTTSMPPRQRIGTAYAEQHQGLSNVKNRSLVT
jgi:hypothetical protein